MKVKHTLYKCKVFFRGFAFIVFFGNLAILEFEEDFGFFIAGLFIAAANHRFSNWIMNRVPYIIGNAFIVHHTRVFNGAFLKGGADKAFCFIVADTSGYPTPSRFTRGIVAHFNNAAILNRFI